MLLPLTLGLLVAVAAAVRSTWSPCGHSMLSTLTPLGERARGHRWGVTAGWFVLGALLGGVTLGAGAAAAAVGVRALDTSPSVLAGTAAVVTAVVLAADAGVGVPLPGHRRQVDENWIGAYRTWVYATGFGWQIGVGIATYTMTAALYLLVALAALTASPVAAVAVCAVFGVVRGLAVLAGRHLDSPAALRTFHRRFEAAEPWSRRLVIAVEAVALLAVAAVWWPPALALSTVVGVASIACVNGRRASRGSRASRHASAPTASGRAQPRRRRPAARRSARGSAGAAASS